MPSTSYLELLQWHVEERPNKILFMKTSVVRIYTLYTSWINSKYETTAEGVFWFDRSLRAPKDIFNEKPEAIIVVYSIVSRGLFVQFTKLYQ